MPTTTKTLYRKVIDIAEDYLGPAGERFIRRQIKTHLGIEPESLRQSQLHALVKWSSLAFALLTDNTENVNEFKRSLLSLSAPKRK